MGIDGDDVADSFEPAGEGGRGGGRKIGQGHRRVAQAVLQMMPGAAPIEDRVFVGDGIITAQTHAGEGADDGAGGLVGRGEFDICGELGGGEKSVPGVGGKVADAAAAPSGAAGRILNLTVPDVDIGKDFDLIRAEVDILVRDAAKGIGDGKETA